MLTVLYVAFVSINLLIAGFISKRQRLYTPDLIKNAVLFLISILSSIAGLLVFRNIAATEIAARVFIDYLGSCIFASISNFALFRFFAWMQAQ